MAQKATERFAQKQSDIECLIVILEEVENRISRSKEEVTYYEKALEEVTKEVTDDNGFIDTDNWRYRDSEDSLNGWQRRLKAYERILAHLEKFC